MYNIKDLLDINKINNLDNKIVVNLINNMNIFHKHLFQKENSILWCKCGEVRNTHQHKWEKFADIKSEFTISNSGIILKCNGCGELKSFFC